MLFCLQREACLLLHENVVLSIMSHLQRDNLQRPVCNYKNVNLHSPFSVSMSFYIERLKSENEKLLGENCKLENGMTIGLLLVWFDY